jgi:hypothetical protein
MNSKSSVDALGVRNLDSSVAFSFYNGNGTFAASKGLDSVLFATISTGLASAGAEGPASV